MLLPVIVLNAVNERIASKASGYKHLQEEACNAKIL